MPYTIRTRIVITKDYNRERYDLTKEEWKQAKAIAKTKSPFHEKVSTLQKHLPAELHGPTPAILTAARDYLQGLYL